MRRRGELIRLLVWLLHARLIYTSLRNYRPTIDMIHERRKEYRLSYTIVKTKELSGLQPMTHWHWRFSGRGWS